MMGINGISNDQIENIFDIHGSNNLFAGENPLKIYPIHPVSLLGGGPGGLVFDPTKMQIMMSKGEIAASSFIADLNPDNINLA